MTDDPRRAVAKVPAVTLGYWTIKILATTLGETGGDTVSMSWLGETSPDAGASGLNGYLVGTAIFGLLLVVLVALQVRARRLDPWLYWATILASTTAGTTLADFATRSLGLGYAGGALLLVALVTAALLLWRRSTGSVDIGAVADRRSERFYWLTITCSQTLGTALGDWVAGSGLGYDGAALVFGALLAAAALLYWRTRVPRVLLFWTAFILTRPLGATVGDYVDKPTAHGGLGLSRPIASMALAAAIVLLIVVLPQRPAKHMSHNEP
ncbi:hypothetical protein [Sphingomonas sp. BK580]|uniref:COG4705 family protein n=1 Tax=Sphingomonas sp. BK580 TaxID=2586972 RepID=UPI00160FB34B|nr:hypothetical protein [Sphingomonas sp. BK580]MBB3693343.1 putative membrane-anchored protein [Sphingomonas sp. BK580]